MDEWGHRTPIYKLTPEDYEFTYPIDLLKQAARLYMQRGESGDVPTLNEVMYRDTTWQNDVHMMAEYYKWARDTLKGN